MRLHEGPRRRHADDVFGGPALRSFHFLQFTPSAEGLEAVVCGLEKGGSDFAPMERFRMTWPDAGGETAVVDEDSRVLVGR